MQIGLDKCNSFGMITSDKQYCKIMINIIIEGHIPPIALYGENLHIYMDTFTTTSEYNGGEGSGEYNGEEGSGEYNGGEGSGE